ncbi:MAG: fluoride efflux transporter CrcB [Verrucomicrobia bacterium]|nr:fluoride efflux transporter CrcB [Verrucomicrobiota bacterium]
MEQIKTYLMVMLGGTVGVAARMWMSSALGAIFGLAFPIGTLVVNVLGCFLIGVFTGLTGHGGVWQVTPHMQQAITIGALGGYTTFSSFSLQTINLLSTGHFLYATLNVVLSVILCLLACWLGLILAGFANAR